jgi:16S rRNA (guanine966-N2)-methyltransferase
MRIIAGSARGRPLKAPKGSSIRPTADRVRQSIFDILGQRMDGDRVLDLYAGTGALGLEGLSRGAESAVLVDQTAEASKLCRENADALGFGERVEVMKSRVEDAIALLAREGTAFTLVLADPPYAERACARILELLDASTLLAPAAKVMIEHSRRESAPDRVGRLVRTDSRRFGDTVASFYENSGANSGA